MRWRTSHFGPILIPFFRSGSASFVLIIYVIFRILFLFFFWSLWEALLLPLESTGKRGDGLTSSSYQHNLYLAAPQSVCVSIHLIVVFIFLNKAPLRGRPSTVWVRFKKKEKKKKKREKKRKKNVYLWSIRFSRTRTMTITSSEDTFSYEAIHLSSFFDFSLWSDEKEGAIIRNEEAGLIMNGT